MLKCLSIRAVYYVLTTDVECERSFVKETPNSTCHLVLFDYVK